MRTTRAASSTRLEQYFERMGRVLGSDERRASFATYAMGLLSETERKSVEPLVAHACIDPNQVDAAHQRMLHFVANSPWSDEKVRLTAAEYAIDAITQEEPIEAWIVDDTGFLKQGKHSVGVQRQYTGSAGKIANCQIGVSLTLATKTEHVPIDFELYVPESWAGDRARRQQARIPDSVGFLTKTDLALKMIRRTLANGIAEGVVLADAAYGTSADFRAELRALGLRYAVGVNPETKVELLSHPGERVSLSELVVPLWEQGEFRRCTWREGSNAPLWARFAMQRVRVSNDEEVWLLIEWRDGEDEPSNFFFANFPRAISKKELVRITMQRWRTERAYEDLKGELGLDHYEGRSFPGWHHHVSVVLACYAFIVAERSRRFPPSARRPSRHSEVPVAA